MGEESKIEIEYTVKTFRKVVKINVNYYLINNMLMGLSEGTLNASNFCCSLGREALIEKKLKLQAKRCFSTSLCRDRSWWKKDERAT